MGVLNLQTRHDLWQYVRCAMWVVPVSSTNQSYCDCGLYPDPCRDRGRDLVPDLHDLPDLGIAISHRALGICLIPR